MPKSKVSNDDQIFTRIGLEIHVTLSSLKKIFSSNSNLPANKRSVNSVEAWELGYLGTLPVLNEEVIKLALKTCLFLKAEISRQLTFDRKIYNYFDLSKGFQITQQKNPIGRNGHFTFLSNGEPIVVPISRIQLEEDTAKASYQKTKIMLDFSRSGNPLLEIVTDPVFNDIDSAVSFVRQLQSSLNYIGVSEAKMEYGELRIDLNFSFVFDSNYETPRYEIKNLNSIKNLKVSFEQELEKNISFYRNRNKDEKNYFSENQTLGFNESLGQTFLQRKKTNYFYLPETNIPTIVINDDQITSLKREMPASLLSLWNKAGGKDNLYYSTMIFEKPLFAIVINSLERKEINYSSSFHFFAVFFFNYILVNIQGYENSEIALFLSEKANFLWDIFLFFEKRMIAKERISNLISLLFIGEYKNCSILQWKELLEKEKSSKEHHSINIEKEILTILDEKRMNKKIMKQPLRATAFLLGSLRKKFPFSDFDYRRVLEIATNIAAMLAN